MDIKHGELNTNGDARWCDVCAWWHGPLYICEHYPNDINNEIFYLIEKFHKDINDPNWIKKQTDNGIHQKVIDILRLLSGAGKTPTPKKD